MPLGNSTGLSTAQVQALMSAMKPTIQPVTPTTGQTVVMTDDNTDGTLYLTPAGTLVALTITFPSDANSAFGQVRRVASTKAITTATLSGGTILNGFTTMIANDCFSYQKVATNTWIRIS